MSTRADEPAKPVELTCGQEVAQSSEVPELLGKLFAHVAINLDAHAAWVGTGSLAARDEHDALLRVAADYRAIGAAANDAVAHMRAMRDLPAVPHDAAKRDKTSFAVWMRTKVELQRALAEMLLAHAAESEKALAAE